MTKKSSIDQKELNKFNKTTEEWWDESGEFKTLHDINPIRIKYIIDKVTKHFNINNSSEHPLEGLEILDVGCGGGLISVPICKLGAKVTALDANENNIKASSEYAKKHKLKIEFINNTVENHSGLYDVLLCLEVIEHVGNIKEFVQNLTKLLKPHGMIILSTINRTIKSYFQAIIMAEYILKWIPINTHNYAKFVKPSELKNMLENTEFQLEELCGLKLSPLTKTWYLSDDIDVNYFAYITC